MRSGAPWRDLPPYYGNWNSIYHKTVLADRAYGSDDIRTYLAQNEVKNCIPDKKNAQIHHSFDREVYKQRNIFERFFGKIKQYHHIATRYDKLSICFWNFIALAAIKIQLK